MLKIYNTLTRRKERFVPQQPGKVSMYVCGPTVYNYIHIGNARSVVAFDTVRRYLEFRGFTVKYISNFTDVDDKMIKAARAAGVTVPQLAEKYIQAYLADTQALNVEPATAHPRATENIEGIIRFTADLIEKGYAYVRGGDVYYRARKFAPYGQLSGQSLDDLEAGASEHVTTAELSNKEDPLDFALWKAAKPGEIHWDSPWGPGRPGWHIECSVMSTRYLGATIDIHAGGQDLEFPHHENEIAQSEPVTGHHFVNYWMHNGFVTIGDQNEKMSKSLGNFVTVHELLKTVDPQVLRFFMATTQYRRPIQYSAARLTEAQHNLAHLSNTYNNLAYRQASAAAGTDPAVAQQVADLRAAFIQAMDDDINVQNGLAVVYELVRLANHYLEAATVQKGTLTALQRELATLVGIFGVKLQATAPADAQIMALIKQRDQARRDKNFALSDQIRDDLRAAGVILEDTPQGTRYRKETKQK